MNMSGGLFVQQCCCWHASLPFIVLIFSDDKVFTLEQAFTSNQSRHSLLNFSSDESNENKRNDYISWSDYFMSVACLSAQRSKDPSTQVGACIVNSEKKIVGIGYNGMPNGCSDDDLPWGKRSENPLDTKYPYVCHAEMNAIMNRNGMDVKNCTIYCTLFPCNECAKLIIQSGIMRVVYMKDKPDKIEMKASRKLFDMARIEYIPFKSSGSKQVVIDFSIFDVSCRIIPVDSEGVPKDSNYASKNKEQINLAPVQRALILSSKNN